MRRRMRRRRSRSIMLIKMNYINDQLDATIIILLTFKSAQHVLGILLPIFRSARLWFTAMWSIVLMLY